MVPVIIEVIQTKFRNFIVTPFIFDRYGENNVATFMENNTLIYRS